MAVDPKALSLSKPPKQMMKLCRGAFPQPVVAAVVAVVAEVEVVEVVAEVEVVEVVVVVAVVAAVVVAEVVVAECPVVK